MTFGLLDSAWNTGVFNTIFLGLALRYSRLNHSCDTGILYEYQFKSWLFILCSSSLLMCLGGQWEMAQVVGPLLLT